jgi:hypothetical protein
MNEWIALTGTWADSHGGVIGTLRANANDGRAFALANPINHEHDMKDCMGITGMWIY